MIVPVVPTLVAVLTVLTAWIGTRAGRAVGVVAMRAWRGRLAAPRTARLVEHGVAALIGFSVAATVPPAPPPAVAVATGPAEPAPEPATMRPLPPSVPPVVPAAEPVDETWTIQPGDHLWGLSHVVLEAALGRPPTDTEIAGYLSEVIERNRHAFAVPTDPDLVFPGQVFVCPPPPAT